MPPITRLSLVVDVDTATAAAKLERFHAEHVRRLGDRWRDVSDQINAGSTVQERAFERVGRSAERNHERVGRSSQQAGRDTGLLANIVRGFGTQIGAVGARVALFTGPLAALAVAGFQVGAALLPLIGLAGALPGLLLAGGAAAGAGLLAFSGMGEALKALSAAELSAGQDAQSNARQQSAAAASIRAAQRGVRDAEQGLQDAQRRSRDAQQDLNQARVEARQRLSDLRAEQERNALSEERALLDVRQAREDLRRTMADPSASGLERASAALRVRESIQRVRDIRRERSETAAQVRQGVEGSDQVKAAKERQQDAERGVRDALERVSDAQANLLQAQQQATQATAQQSAASLKLKQTMDALPAPTRAVVMQLFGMRGMLTQLRDVAAAGIMPGVSSALRAVSGLFPTVRSGIAGVSGVIGGLIQRAGALTQTTAFRRDFAGVMRDNVTVVRNFGDAGLYLMQAFWDVVGAARPMVRTISDAVAQGARWVAVATRGARESGTLSRFFDAAQRTAAQLGRILGNIILIFARLGGAAAPAGRSILDTIESLTAAGVRFSANAERMRTTLHNVAGGFLLVKAALVGAAFGPWGIAIGLLAAGLFLAYQRSATFRNAVNNLIQTIGRVALPIFRALSAWVTGQLIPAFVKVVPFVRDQLMAGFRSLSRALSDNREQFSQVGKVLLAVGAWIATRLVPVLVRLYALYLRVLLEQLAAGVRAFGLVVRAIAITVASVRDAGNRVGAFIRLIRDAWNTMVRSTADAWRRFRTSISDGISRAWATVTGWDRNVRDLFSRMIANATGWGRSIWRNVTAGIRGIDLVGAMKGILNRGIGMLQGFINNIADGVNRVLPGSPVPKPRLPTLRQTGGLLPGDQTGPNRDSVPWVGVPGEMVLQRPSVRELVRRFGNGVLNWLNNAHRWPRTLPDVGGDPGVMRVRRQQGGIIPRVQQWIRQQDPKPYIWAGVGPRGFDCSGLAGAVWALLAGRNPHQRYFTTTSIGGFGGLKPGRGTYTIGVTAGTGHMAGNLAGLGFEARSSRAGILVGSAARNVMSFARQFYMPQVGGQFIAGGGGGGGNIFTAIVDRLVGAAVRTITGGLSRFGGNTVVGRTMSSIGGAAVRGIGDWVRGLASFSLPTGGAGTMSAGAALTNWIRAAIQATGVPLNWGPAILRRIRFESGGNRLAVNNYDSNARRGTPSKGLMQVIDPTFRAYHEPGTSWDIFDAVANIAAAINYIRARYGSIFSIDPPLRGYAGGGTIWERIVGVGASGRRYLFGERGPETVVPGVRAGAGGLGAGVSVAPGAIYIAPNGISIRLEGTVDAPVTREWVWQAVHYMVRSLRTDTATGAAH
jgi:hypothetical protein